MNNINGYGFYQNAGMVGENIRKFGHKPEGAGKLPGKNGEDPAAMYVRIRRPMPQAVSRAVLNYPTELRRSLRN